MRDLSIAFRNVYPAAKWSLLCRPARGIGGAVFLFLTILCAAALSACDASGLAAKAGLDLPTQSPVGVVTATYTPFPAASPTATATRLLSPTPLPSPTATPCPQQNGQIEQMEEVVRQGRPPFKFRVYFPPCFSKSSSFRYPVLYMIHGQASTEDQWERLGIGAAADALIKEKKTTPFLIVMPLEKDTYEDIYLAGFSRDVTDGLIPWIDQTYPTCTERACRAIGGLSRGGAWALHLGFTHWELFGSVGLHSTPPFNTDPGLFPTWLKSIPSEQLPRVWMDTGRRDAFLSYTSEFEEELVENGVPHEWYIFNGMHEESYWEAHVADYLEWYSRPWKDLR